MLTGEVINVCISPGEATAWALCRPERQLSCHLGGPQAFTQHWHPGSWEKCHKGQAGSPWREGGPGAS